MTTDGLLNENNIPRSTPYSTDSLLTTSSCLPVLFVLRVIMLSVLISETQALRLYCCVCSQKTGLTAPYSLLYFSTIALLLGRYTLI